MILCLLVCGVRNRRIVVWMFLFGWVLLLVPTVRAQMTDEEKKRLFLQAREDIRPVAKPSPSATPRPKPQPASTPKPTPKATPKITPQPDEKPEPEETPRLRKPTPEPEETPRLRKPTPEPEETPTPRPKQPTPEPEETPTPRPRKPSPEPEETPSPRPKKPTPESSPERETPKASGTPDFIDLPDLPKPEKPAATPAGSPPPQPLPAISPAQIPQGTTPQGHPLDAPIVVEKSGLEADQGIEPAPKSQFGGFFKRYRYLTPAVRKAIDQAKVQRGRWKYIIIHNSGTRQGNARIFDVYHRRVRKMQNGLAYHFVIGNGNSSGNGEIEIGSRWTRQINGGHVASDYLNNIALGICLVGDLNRDKPTKEQLAALDELIAYLRSRVGKIKGKSAIVKGHKEINPKPTDCPGDRFDLGWLRQRFR